MAAEPHEWIKSSNVLTGQQRAALADVLALLADGARRAVGDGFAGAYLVGSLACGQGDAHSDVDFLVVTEDGLTRETERRVRRLHAELPALPGWARHLEGSYTSRAALRGPERGGDARGGDGRGWLYVDNGSREMEWSAHDDSANLRWVLWHHGVALVGPPPRSLLDAVSPERLTAEAAAAVDRLAALAADDPGLLSTAWSQPHCVLAMCRFLFTLATGTVTSKVLAGRWAIGRLDGRWSALIRRAIEDRPDPWGRVGRPSDPATVAPTTEFLRSGPRMAAAGARG